ncbi:hypothetical protein HaLaN_07556 [Haematococcus lacustris]|uniref:Uncharacterized protein n=1 Tax=Haematococcus lacustris TaxID=44745 RepID=A0A699YY83_HAELA|nr:hypothetical protein HaLaN_07556 [Haematococcus lacustris]
MSSSRDVGRPSSEAAGGGAAAAEARGCCQGYQGQGLLTGLPGGSIVSSAQLMVVPS